MKNVFGGALGSYLRSEARESTGSTTVVESTGVGRETALGLPANDSAPGTAKVRAAARSTAIAAPAAAHVMEAERRRAPSPPASTNARRRSRMACRASAQSMSSPNNAAASATLFPAGADVVKTKANTKHKTGTSAAVAAGRAGLTESSADNAPQSQVSTMGADRR